MKESTSSFGHFHAEYQGQQATFTFDGNLLAGEVPPSAHRLIREWAMGHTGDLEANWERARRAEPLERIPPLE